MSSMRAICRGSAALTASNAIGSACAACSSDPRPVDSRHVLVLEYVPVPLNEPVNDVSGSCAANDTLLGAGYRMTAPSWR
jgi:hypothetical protein